MSYYLPLLHIRHLSRGGTLAAAQYENGQTRK